MRWKMNKKNSEKLQGWEGLAIAIIESWAKDYRSAFKDMLDKKCTDNNFYKKIIKDLNKEMDTPFFLMLGIENSDYYKRKLITQILKERRKSINKRIKAQKGSY